MYQILIIEDTVNMHYSDKFLISFCKPELNLQIKFLKKHLYKLDLSICIEQFHQKRG